MGLIARRTKLDTSSEDETCILLFHDGKLFACLTQLSCEVHSGLGGQWFVERIFDEPLTLVPEYFQEMEEAVSYVTHKVFGRSMCLSQPPIDLTIHPTQQ